MDSLQGHLLVATPALADPNFSKTVLLMIQHDEQGALGVVLNRPLSKTVKELWQQVSDDPCPSEKPVNLGGPVSGPLMAVHTDKSLAELEISPGIYFSAQKRNLDQLVRQQAHRFRIFLCHSGWGEGQLEGEMEQGAWMTIPATTEYVFSDGDNLWDEVAKHIGNSMLLSTLKIKHVPDDPSVN